MSNTSTTDLGAVTAYADAKAHGYTGTREEFGQLLANAGINLPKWPKKPQRTAHPQRPPAQVTPGRVPPRRIPTPPTQPRVLLMLQTALPHPKTAPMLLQNRRQLPRKTPMPQT